VPVGAITEQPIRDWMAQVIDEQRSGAISAKTINNARAALSCALGDASRLDVLPRNTCEFIAPLPVEHRELDYLRLAEIDRYLDACAARVVAWARSRCSASSEVGRGCGLGQRARRLRAEAAPSASTSASA
jgi:hypothetical protein